VRVFPNISASDGQRKKVIVRRSLMKNLPQGSFQDSRRGRIRENKDAGRDGNTKHGHLSIDDLIADEISRPYNYGVMWEVGHIRVRQWQLTPVKLRACSAKLRC